MYMYLFQGVMWFEAAGGWVIGAGHGEQLIRTVNLSLAPNGHLLVPGGLFKEIAGLHFLLFQHFNQLEVTPLIPLYIHVHQLVGVLATTLIPTPFRLGPVSKCPYYRKNTTQNLRCPEYLNYVLIEGHHYIYIFSVYVYIYSTCISWHVLNFKRCPCVLSHRVPVARVSKCYIVCWNHSLMRQCVRQLCATSLRGGGGESGSGG